MIIRVVPNPVIASAEMRLRRRLCMRRILLHEQAIAEPQKEIRLAHVEFTQYKYFVLICGRPEVHGLRHGRLCD